MVTWRFSSSPLTCFISWKGRSSFPIWFVHSCCQRLRSAVARPPSCWEGVKMQTKGLWKAFYGPFIGDQLPGQKGKLHASWRAESDQPKWFWRVLICFDFGSMRRTFFYFKRVFLCFSDPSQAQCFGTPPIFSRVWRVFAKPHCAEC